MRILNILPVVAAALPGPKDVQEVVRWAFPEGDGPAFTSLPSSPNFAVAFNDSAILKVIDLKISPNPLRPGNVKFAFTHLLTDTLPEGSELHLRTWVGHNESYESSVDFCEQMGYAKLKCPTEKYRSAQTLERMLQVPDQAMQGRFSFVASLTTPDDDLLAVMAGVADLENENYHDEL